ncbi:MAG: hypothetical protein U5L09_02765 [Bacteroidales bacterium]|nr:hypothetical protein [Bacteroidales bacterium]
MNRYYYLFGIVTTNTLSVVSFDTETTGLPKNFNAPVSDSANWPRMVQLAWQIHNEKGNLVEAHEYIVKPEGYEIPYNATKIQRPLLPNEKAPRRKAFRARMAIAIIQSTMGKADFVEGRQRPVRPGQHSAAKYSAKALKRLWKR